MSDDVLISHSLKGTGPPRLELGMPGSKPGVLPITPRAIGTACQSVVLWADMGPGRSFRSALSRALCPDALLHVADRGSRWAKPLPRLMFPELEYPSTASGYPMRRHIRVTDGSFRGKQNEDCRLTGVPRQGSWNSIQASIGDVIVIRWIRGIRWIRWIRRVRWRRRIRGCRRAWRAWRTGRIRRRGRIRRIRRIWR